MSDDFCVAAERALLCSGTLAWGQLSTREQADAIYRELRALDSEHVATHGPHDVLGEIMVPKVLIVEDDLLVADMSKRTLIRSGYEVCGIARTVTDAVALALCHEPDLALIDVRLKGGDLGTDIPPRLGNLRKLGVLYSTGNAAKAMTAGIQGHACLSKPYDDVALLRALKVVSEIVATGRASKPFPFGFRVLDSITTGHDLEQRPN
ncbi:MAG: response regulator [Acetobacteraceae bacterium]|jgi:CheY-like chemotaxis protein